MKFQRIFTTSDFNPHKHIAWKTVTVGIKADNGSTVLGETTIEVPESWSQSATDILAHKYLRKTGVPQIKVPITPHYARLPDWLCPHAPAKGDSCTSAETSAHQAFHRLAGHWTYTAYLHEYFETAECYHAFYDELYYMLANQIFSPNSPQWFNTGLWWAYGIRDKSGASAYRAEFAGQDAKEITEAYEYPQTSACFILGLRDSLLGPSGIMDTLTTEARIFKYGSGSGINYSTLRPQGAPLHNGGVSSGLMSFLNVFDANAGAIKSGGTTRRAARMIVVDADHPEAIDVARWKVKEELKVAAMANGAKNSNASTPYGKEVLNSLTTTYESEAYKTVSGQNANNSIRVTDDFMRKVLMGIGGPLDTDRDKELFFTICEAAHAVGDPGMQFHDNCNKWHTIPKAAPQRATNPCSEFSFIDNSSCNLASINLLAFRNTNNSFNHVSFRDVVRAVTIVLDLTISMSSFPTKDIAENTENYRPLGLGFANLGGLLMASGIPYDSYAGRAYAATITSTMQAVAWQTSAELVDNDNLRLMPILNHDMHAQDIANVLKLHVQAHTELGNSPRVQLPDGVDRSVRDMYQEASLLWAQLVTSNRPIRNAQLTLLAPTGTTGLVMDCATTGIEPDFSLVKMKKLAGGGTMTLTNNLVRTGLESLGYEEGQIRQIETHIAKFGRVDKTTPFISLDHMKVFDCANDIAWQGHVAMMAAVQPFLSGAISKTVNLPNDAKINDVRDVFITAWESGLKAIAVYRDGCKLAQPLTAKIASVQATVNPGADNDDAAPAAEPSPAQALIKSIAGDDSVSIPRKAASAVRYSLPSRRNGFTQKAVINGHKLYLRTGEYQDGRIGELFVSISKEGSTLKHLLDGLAQSSSIALQYGVPLQEFVDAFADSKSEPCGLVQGSDHVRMCSSLLDYIVRELAATYSKRVTNEIQPHDDTNSDDDNQSDIMSEPITMPKVVITGGLRTMARPNYIGDSCPSCNSFTLRRNGTCMICDTCGQTTGCS